MESFHTGILNQNCGASIVMSVCGVYIRMPHLVYWTTAAAFELGLPFTS